MAAPDTKLAGKYSCKCLFGKEKPSDELKYYAEQPLFFAREHETANGLPGGNEP